MQSSQIFGFLSIFTTYLLLTACSSGGGESESNEPSSTPSTGFSATAVHTNSVASSPYCPAGGVEILTGVDVNQNGVLDPNEVNDTQELCHIDSDRILAQVENLSANTDCTLRRG